MYKAMSLAAIAAVTVNVADAAMPHWKMAKLHNKGIDVEKLHNKADIMVSRSAVSLHKAQLRSTRLQAVHKFNKLGQNEFDEAVDEEEQRVLDLVCDGDVDSCEAEQIDKVEYAFDIMKGLAIGITATFSSECRAGLVGMIDALLNIWNHIEIYLPANFNKFGIAVQDLTNSGNIAFTFCDVSHMWSELSKLADWENWEQYIEIAFRAGGVFIEDMWIEIDRIETAAEAGDGLTVGNAIGDLIGLFLDTLM